MTDLSPASIDKLVALGAAGAQAIPHPHGGLAVQVPHGYDLQHIAPLDAVLTRIKQRVTFDDRDSFCGYVNDFKDDNCRIFASIAQGTITAILDYHSAEAPDYCDHRAIYTLPYSEQWRRWSYIDGKLQEQRPFAEFIEENLADVYEPAGAELFDVASSLQTTRKLDFQSGVNLHNGTTQFTYSESDNTRTGKQQLTVPQKITLGIPIYLNEQPQAVTCFFRHRIVENQLRFMVRIHQRELLLQQAFRAIATNIQAATKLPVLYGDLR